MTDCILTQDRQRADQFYTDPLHPVTLDAAALADLQQLTDEYHTVLHQALAKEQTRERLLAIGRRLLEWLRQRSDWAESLNQPLSATLEWRLQPALSAPDTPGGIIAAAPWELLANESGFFATQSGSRFVAIRRLLNGGGDYAPRDHRLSLVFMAASPAGLAELDYRREEVAIAENIGRTGIDLLVDESGELAQLADTLSFAVASECTLEVLHLSCHGSRAPQPQLAFETETGGLQQVDAPTLWEETQHGDYHLAFISACHSAAELGAAPGFARQLVISGAPATITWDGAVYDHEAIHFAGRLYQLLNRGNTLVDAYRSARNTLAQSDSQCWHLCRLLLAEQAGARLVNGSAAQRPQPRRHAESAFLDSQRRVPIAGFSEFVSRRRELQSGIYALSAHTALLIHGPGHIGKSSLAGRLARRMDDHRHIVCFGTDSGNVRQVVSHIIDACQNPAISAYAEKMLRQWEQTPTHLSELLNALITKVEEQDRPLLLILDDVEQLLQATPPTTDLHRLRPEYEAPLSGILRCFQRYDGRSRLLLTSRFTFVLAGDNHALSDTLQKIQLRPFSEHEHQRQLLQLRQFRDNAQTVDAAQQTLLTRALGLASGNPGLLREMVDIILTDATAAPALLAQIAAYIDHGHDPTDSRVADYLQDLAINAKLAALNDSEQQVLRWLSPLHQPIAQATIAALIETELHTDGDTVCARLLSFGLLDRTPNPVESEQPACAVNRLAAPKIVPADNASFTDFARCLTPQLNADWPSAHCPAWCDIQLCQLADKIGDADIFNARIESALTYLDNNSLYSIGYLLAKAALAHSITALTPQLARTIANQLCASASTDDRDLEQAAALYTQAITALPEPKSPEAAVEYGALLRDQAALRKTLGDPVQALSTLQNLARLLGTFKLIREQAIVLGDIARIKVDRGEVEAALHLQDECLQIMRQLGDQSGIAAAQNDRFDILWQQQSAEAAIKAISESFQILLQIGRMDGLGVVGMKFGQVLMLDNQQAQARQVLQAARQAWEVLDHQTNLAQIDEWLGQLDADNAPNK